MCVHDSMHIPMSPPTLFSAKWTHKMGMFVFPSACPADDSPTPFRHMHALQVSAPSARTLPSSVYEPVPRTSPSVPPAFGCCHETTTHGLTWLESSGIPDIEHGIIWSAWMACSLPACRVLIVYARLLSIGCLCPSPGTRSQGKRNSNEEQ